MVHRPEPEAMITQANIQSFIARQRLLLERERKAEIERSSLLLSNCGPKLLEQKGLSLGGLGIVSVNIGLGGKTYALLPCYLSFLRLYLPSADS